MLGSGRKGGAGHLQGPENKMLLFTGGFFGVGLGEGSKELVER